MDFGFKFMFYKFILCKANDGIYFAPIVFVDDSFFVIGGVSYEITSDNVYRSESNIIGRLNAQTRKWSRAGQLVSARYGHGAIFDGSSLVVVGGCCGTLKTEICQISSGEVSCREQTPSLTSYSYYPELYLVNKDFCKTRP